MLVIVVMLLATACSDDSPTEGPVTIVAQWEFDDGLVFGTFEVTEGADALGCSSGAFKDSRVDPENWLRVFACESGSNDGTFSATFNYFDTDDGPGNASGSWSVAEGSEDFVGLQGDGEWFGVYDQTIGVNEGVETWTGDISYTS
jgi:hypothetical protein